VTGGVDRDLKSDVVDLAAQDVVAISPRDALAIERIGKYGSEVGADRDGLSSDASSRGDRRERGGVPVNPIGQRRILRAGQHDQ